MIKSMSHNKKCARHYGNSTPNYKNNTREIENVRYIVNNKHCTMRHFHSVITKSHIGILPDF